MTEQLSSITPPPELVENWYASADDASEDVIQGISNRAAQWGADQELEACVQWSIDNQHPRWAKAVQAARRPKPLSLKQQALAVLDDCGLDAAHENAIRRALEALDDSL